MTIITTGDLLQYLYNEASPKKAATIEAALENDWALRETYESLVSGKNQLETIRLSPREDVVKRICDYAEKSVGQLNPH